MLALPAIRTLRYAALLCLLATAGSSALCATRASEAPPRTGALYGTLLDNGRPVPHSIITFPGLWLETMTELDGTFRLAGIPEGPHVLRVRRFKRKDFSVRVNIVADRVDTIVVNVPRPGVEPPPCPRPTPECTERDRRQHGRIGLPCEVHPEVTLAADTVRILHVARALPGQAKVQRDSFPNALTWWYMPMPTTRGRLVGGSPSGFGSQRRRVWPSGRTPVGGGPWWIEVAYCSECRAALARFIRQAAPGTSKAQAPANEDGPK